MYCLYICRSKLFNLFYLKLISEIVRATLELKILHNNYCSCSYYFNINIMYVIVTYTNLYRNFNINTNNTGVGMLFTQLYNVL